MVFINLSTNVSDHLYSHTKINTVDSYVSVSPDHEYEDDNRHNISNSNHHTLLPSQMCIQLTYTLPCPQGTCHVVTSQLASDSQDPMKSKDHFVIVDAVLVYQIQAVVVASSTVFGFAFLYFGTYTSIL